MYDLNDLDRAWNDYFQLNQVTPPEYDDEIEEEAESEDNSEQADDE